MKRNRKTALYFLDGGKLTPETEADAYAIEAAHNVNVKFRNGSIEASGAPEKSDFIAGGPIPTGYAGRDILTATGVIHATVDTPSVAEVPQATEAATGLAAEVGAVGAVPQQNSGGWG